MALTHGTKSPMPAPKLSLFGTVQVELRRGAMNPENWQARWSVAWLVRYEMVRTTGVTEVC